MHTSSKAFLRALFVDRSVSKCFSRSSKVALASAYNKQHRLTITNTYEERVLINMVKHFALPITISLI